jgi:uncharacterized RDD family membrane protein YckC
MLYDAFLVVALVGVVNAIALGVVVWFTGGAQQVLNPHVVQLLSAFSTVGFFSVFWLKSGQTLGMQAWRIKLVNRDGGAPNTGQCVLRCCGAFVSAACLGLGYLWCLIDRKGYYWHDYLSSTEIILQPKKEKDSAT